MGRKLNEEIFPSPLLKKKFVSEIKCLMLEGWEGKAQVAGANNSGVEVILSLEIK